MDINKEREAFEQALVNQKNVSINNLHVCTIFDAEKNKYSPSDVCDPKEDFIVDWINSSWSIWQAAKASVAPHKSCSVNSHEIIINETKSELIDSYDIAKEDEYLLESLVYRGVCIGKAQTSVAEGFVLVPKEPTFKMARAYQMNSVAPVSSLSVSGYKAMIEAQEPSND